MNRIIGIGACVADTLITLPRFPDEDTKLRAESTKQSGGGPAATGVVAAAKLGVPAGFIGNLTDDACGKFLLSDFEKYNVDTSGIQLLPGYRSFASCIWLNKAKGTRTCVFDKGNLPPLRLTAAHKSMIGQTEVLMVDGNDLSAACDAAEVAKESGVTVLYDAGGLYDGIERLLPLADILIPSEEFAIGYTGARNAESAAEILSEQYKPKVIVITQGKRGGLMWEKGKITYYPIYPAEVVDSNGAGDVFHGAFAAGIVRGYGFEQCCHYASAVSSLKCTGIGARERVPAHETVIKYLKENGYEL